MNIAIAGGTGFVGVELTSYLLNLGHKVFVLTRSSKGKVNKPNLTYIEWLTNTSKPEEDLNDIDAFVNLAGESINSGRWTEKRKQQIRASRSYTTSELIRIIKNLNKKPAVLINASAVGYYGTSTTTTFTEKHLESGQDFLAQTTALWEHEASKSQDLGVRTVFCRFGIILDKENGALPKMALPYKLFVGGKVGFGEQWLSWIHITDTVRMIVFAMENDKVEGALNVTAPQPERMNEFGSTVGKALHRPHWIPVPSFALKLLLGEMSILVLKGQYVYPQKAIDNGFTFLFPYLEKALLNIYKT